MRFDRGLIGFGLFLVTVGAVMVAVRQGLISDDLAGRAWSLWPLILIGIGLSIVLAGRPGAAIGGLVLAVTFGAMLGGIAATGSLGFVGLCSGDRDRGTPFADASGDLSSSATVSVRQSCGDLTISTVSGATWSLSGVSTEGRAPRVEGSASSLTVESDEDAPFSLSATSAWDLVLPRDPALALEIEANAGAARITLGGANLTRLDIQRNAGTLEVDLRDVAAIDELAVQLNAGSATLRLPARSLTGTLDVNAGSASICLPAGAGLRVALDSVAASNDFGSHGLVERDGAWETAGYATATIRIALRAEVNAGSLSLDPVRPCAG